MVTALLIVLAAVVVLVMHQCVNDPFMWVFHLCAGTVTSLLEILGWLLAAIWAGFGGSSSSSS